MVHLEVVNGRGCPFLPVFRVVFMPLAFNGQAVTAQVDEMGVRGDHIDRVARNHDHLVRCEWKCSSRQAHWIVRLGNPYGVRVADCVVSKESHDALEEGELHGHVGTCEQASDLLKIASQESVAAASIRLERNLFARHVNGSVEEQVFVTVLSLATKLVEFLHVFLHRAIAEQQILKFIEIDRVCRWSWEEMAIFIDHIFWKESFQTIRAKF